VKIVVRWARTYWVDAVRVILRVLLACFLVSPMWAVPFRGSVPWSVILCRASDAGAPPHDVSYYQNLIVNLGTGGLADYWHDVSYQNLNLNGSVVKGWYTVNKTAAQWADPAFGRWDRVALCEDTAKNDPNDPYTIPANHHKIIITFPAVDFFGWNGGAFVSWDADPGGLAHEGGHGIGLNHSFSNNFNYLNTWWAAISEYDDPWDAMSWGNAYRVPTPFGDGAPWMIAFNLDRLGWLPRSRILTFGANGATDATYTLTALSHPESPGHLLIRVPFDTGDPMHYYTIEYRKRERWDAGIPADTVLIHEVYKRFDPAGNPQGHYAALQRDLAAGAGPMQFLGANGVFVHVVSTNPANATAQVRIVSNYATHCLVGFVWREARSYDHVCVPPSERAETQQENGLAGDRVNPGGGPFGPDTCKQGFVWREAIRPEWRSDDPDDHVCVPGSSRTRAGQSNAADAERKNPARVSYGPNTCKQGFVWREADDFDWVCVTGATRDQVRSDNSLASSRRNPGGGPFGPDTCKQGFVWREAFPGDHVCVVPATRSAAAADNQQAAARMLEP
jgi:hypothetical protein